MGAFPGEGDVDTSICVEQHFYASKAILITQNKPTGKQLLA